MDPKSRPAPAAQIVYEDIEPEYTWETGKEADTLFVDLTGFKNEEEFKREHLKVTIDNLRKIKVSGEQSLGNRGRRFQKVFQMAKDCSTGNIKAKFDNGVLTVVMPKLPGAQAPATTAAAQPPVTPAKPEPTAGVMSREAESGKSVVSDEGRAGTGRKAREEGKARAASPADGGTKDLARDEKEAAAAEKPGPLALRSSSPPHAAEADEGKHGTGALGVEGTRRRPWWPRVHAAADAEEGKHEAGVLNMTGARRRPWWPLVKAVLAVMAVVWLAFYWRYGKRVTPPQLGDPLLPESSGEWQQELQSSCRGSCM